jgi:hypothetical protein
VGNLHANGNITVGPSSNFLRVSGNVLTRGNYLQQGGKVGGFVRANGDATMGWTQFILNTENQGYDIQYGGQGSFIDTNNNKKYEAAEYNVNPNVAKVKDSDSSVANHDASDPATNCDYLNITNEVTNIIGGDGLNNASLPKFNGTSNGDHSFEYTAAGIKGREIRNGKLIKIIANIAPVNAQVFGKSTSVVKLSKFSLDNTMDVNGGDLTLFVDGDFSMAGSARMTIEKDSSLTLIVTGTVNLLAGAKIIANQHGLTASGLPAMSIYSSYNSDTENKAGIKIEGAFETYTQIYAPLAEVKINGSGTLYGAVRGKTVAVTGGAAIHYDAALGATSQGSSSSGQQAPLQFVGFEY